MYVCTDTSNSLSPTAAYHARGGRVRDMGPTLGGQLRVANFRPRLPHGAAPPLCNCWVARG